MLYFNARISDYNKSSNSSGLQIFARPKPKKTSWFNVVRRCGNLPTKSLASVRAEETESLISAHTQVHEYLLTRLVGISANMTGGLAS